MRQEIRQVSEQYSVKCLECAELLERLEVQSKSVQEGRRRIHDLLARSLVVICKKSILFCLVFNKQNQKQPSLTLA